MSESEHMLPMHLHLSRSDKAFEPQNVAYAKLTFAPRKHLHAWQCIVCTCLDISVFTITSSAQLYSILCMLCAIPLACDLRSVETLSYLGVWPYDHRLPGIQEIYGGEYSEHKTLHALTVNHRRKDPINILSEFRFLQSVAHCFNKPKDTSHCTALFWNSVYYEIVVDSASRPMILLL